jgi:hypothetical protein
VRAAQALEVVEDRSAAGGVGLDVVVLEERASGAAGLGAFDLALVDDPALSTGRGASSGAGIDGLAFGVVEQQGHECIGK